MADDELYFVVAGELLDTISKKLVTIIHANNELDKFHRARLSP
jgi:hypothetical protein